MTPSTLSLLPTVFPLQGRLVPERWRPGSTGAVWAVPVGRGETVVRDVLVAEIAEPDAARMAPHLNVAT
jgi:hypothetical protein